MSDYKGAALMLPAMPKARELLADKGYDADWFRAALAKHGVTACIPSKSNRTVAIPHDAIHKAAPQNREHVRTAQGLAAHPHPIRPLRPHLFLSNLYRRSRHILAVINESEPSALGASAISA